MKIKLFSILMASLMLFSISGVSAADSVNVPVTITVPSVLSISASPASIQFNVLSSGTWTSPTAPLIITNNGNINAGVSVKLQAALANGYEIRSASSNIGHVDPSSMGSILPGATKDAQLQVRTSGALTPGSTNAVLMFTSIAA